MKTSHDTALAAARLRAHANALRTAMLEGNLPPAALAAVNLAYTEAAKDASIAEESAEQEAASEAWEASGVVLADKIRTLAAECRARQVEARGEGYCDGRPDATAALLDAAADHLTGDDY